MKYKMILIIYLLTLPGIALASDGLNAPMFQKQKTERVRILHQQAKHNQDRYYQGRSDGHRWYHWDRSPKHRPPVYSTIRRGDRKGDFHAHRHPQKYQNDCRKPIRR